MRPSRTAFTLLEMVLVLAILVIVAGLAYPSVQGMYGGYKVRASADEVRAAWASARARAVAEGRAYRFAVVPGTSNYRVAPDSSDFWNGGAPAGGDGADAPLVLESAIEKGVRFGSLDAIQAGRLDQGGDSTPAPGHVDSSQWTTLVTFLPDGTADQDVTIVLQVRGATPLVLRMRALTGFVSVREQQEGHKR